MTTEMATSKQSFLEALKQNNLELYNRIAAEYKREFVQMGRVPKLAKISISHGHKNFILPDDSTTVKLVGVVMAIGYMKELYDENDEESKAPICSAVNSPKGNKYGECASCKFYEWGSGSNGKGRACQYTRRLIIAMKGSPTPFELKIPATSAGAFDKALSNAMATLTVPYPLLNIIATLRVEESGGNAYSKVEVKFELADNLTPQKVIGRLDGAKKYQTYFEDAYGNLHITDSAKALEDKNNAHDLDDGGAAENTPKEEAAAKPKAKKSKKKAEEKEAIEEVDVDEVPV